MLINRTLAGKKNIATQYGNIDFDSKGVSKDLTEKEQKVLGELANFKYETSKEEKEAEDKAKKLAEETAKAEKEKTEALRKEAEKESNVQVDDKNENPVKNVKKTAVKKPTTKKTNKKD